MTESGSPSSFRFLARRWRLVVVVALVAAAVAAIASAAQSTSYRSTAKLLVGAPALSSAGTSSEDPVRALDTIVKLAKTHDVLAVAAHRADTTIGAVSGAVSISGDPNADILTVTGTAPTARSARASAAALATGLVAWERRREGELLRARVASLENQLSQFEGRTTPSTVAAAADLRTQLVEARADLSSSKSDITIVGPATLPSSPYAPRPLRNALLGLLAGLIVGLAAAALRDRLDRRVRDADELSGLYAAPVLGALRNTWTGRAHADFGADDPRADEVRTIRTNLLLSAPERKSGGRVVTVTSATAGEGKTAFTANLAQAFASGGYRVLAVSAEPRAPHLHRHFELVLDPSDTDDPPTTSKACGLFDVLCGEAELEDAVRPAALIGTSDDATVALLANSRTALDPARLFQSPAMTRLLEAAQESYDVVLIDGPPLLAQRDAALLASRSDAALVVARLDALDRDVVREAHDVLASSRVPAAGVVVTGARLGRRPSARGASDRSSAAAVPRQARSSRAAYGLVRRSVAARLRS